MTCDIAQTSVARPQQSAWRQMHARQEMCIDESDAPTKKPCVIDEVEHFIIGGDGKHRQIAQEPQYGGPLLQMATGQLTNDKRMNCDIAHVEGRGQCRLMLAKMIDPH